MQGQKPGQTKGTPVWKCRRGPISVGEGPAGIMGIVNLTPDSFFECTGTSETGMDEGLALALRHIREGADCVDLGAESSRPGAAPVTADEEAARLLPCLRALAAHPGHPVISIDTYHAATAAAALEAGADVINDISACRFSPDMLDVLVSYKPGYVLMHCQGTPETMQKAPSYADPVSEVSAFFEERMNMLVRAGLPEENILLDPGIGFGKSMQHNLSLIRHPEGWRHLGRPSLMALSMKTVLGDVTGLPVAERGPATQVATAMAFERGYLWHRVHRTAPARQAILLASTLAQS